jgi:hypothetical protein
MATFPHSELDEYKTQAVLLLKQLRSDDSHVSLKAAERFQQLSHLTNTTLAEIAASDQIKLKHALNVIALEHKHDNWADFKQNLERKENFRAKLKDKYTLVYPKRCSHIMNGWHPNYESASNELKEIGGYLFPYKNQFFICDTGYIRALGLDPDDPDWALIEWDWAQPAADKAAWERLNAKLLEVSEEV